MKLKYLTLVTITLLTACSDDFLDKKSNKSLTVPETIKDFWALLDNNEVMQFTPALGQLGCDDYYYEYDTWNAQAGIPRTCYTWEKDIFNGGRNLDWNICYNQVYLANCVLEGVEKIPDNPTNKIELDNIRGSALFMRAYAFFNLAETFSKPYNSSTAGMDLGIPLRLTSDLSAKSVRPSLEQNYNQLLSDLQEAIPLVPAELIGNKSRPCRVSVLALLSRIYLSMGDYENAKRYADSCLSVYSELLDYNKVDTLSNIPFNNKNPEVLYQSYLYSGYIPLVNASNTLMDTVLLRSYDASDLRSKIFFRRNSAGKFYFKGRYTAGPSYMFSGLATDEVFLIRAECNARAGNTAEALKDLNNLLQKRWKKDLFVPIKTSNSETALRVILTERRKELVFRGIRWSDLRRLNKEHDFAVPLTRSLKGKLYTLPPNDPKYVYPIPDIETALSGIQQNER